VDSCALAVWVNQETSDASGLVRTAAHTSSRT